MHILSSALPILHHRFLNLGISPYESANKKVRVTTLFPHQFKMSASIHLADRNSVSL